jgi:RNA polymerase sigma-70 factor, ECF subfamily
VIVRSVPAMIQVMEARTATELRLSTSHEGTDDARRFESIYREHFGLVAAYARRRVPARADDVVAETFLVAWRRLDDVPADALPWLYGVARRVVSDFRRGSRRQDAVANRLASLGEPRHSGHGESDEELLAALARLSDQDRELLLLVYWEDLEPSRAALALGCSRATVATRLWRARARLRKELDRTKGDRR